MSLWIGLCLPCHSLDTLFPLWPTKTPLAAVLEQDRIHALTPAAQAQGLRLGMRRATAASLLPEAALLNRNPQAEQQSLQRLALDLLQYTPNIVLGEAGVFSGLLLEVSASLMLFKGIRALCRDIRATLQRHQALCYCLSTAPTAQGAKLLASQSQTVLRRAVKLKTLHRMLDPLPINLLVSQKNFLNWFKGLGCRTLAHLQQLPRNGVRQRSDPAIIQGLDTAYGRSPESFVWFQPPELFSLRHDLLENLEHTHAVQFVAKHLIEQLCTWLHARQCAADTLVFLLHHEKGRHALPPSRLLLLLSQPGWQPEDFMRVLAEQLRQFTLRAQVIALELSIPAVQSRPEPSLSLFPEPAQWQTDELRLLDLLRARLGGENLLQPQPFADHRPERANIWAPMAPTSGKKTATLARTPNETGAWACRQSAEFLRLDPHARPFWLLAQPCALDTSNDRPVYRNAVLRLIRGPERIESGWWDGTGNEQRDYFIAQDPQFARYWIYRQRASLEARWFLHGLFG
ncbi:Y-family DNA polymerase [Eoetvoesiella caeni]